MADLADVLPARFGGAELAVLRVEEAQEHDMADLWRRQPGDLRVPGSGGGRSCFPSMRGIETKGAWVHPGPMGWGRAPCVTRLWSFASTTPDSFVKAFIHSPDACKLSL
jgi:hypothetical protein